MRLRSLGHLLATLATLALLAACSDSGGGPDAVVTGPDATSMDRTAPADTGPTDAGFPDAHVNPDAAAPDATPADGGRPEGILVPGLTSTVTVDYDAHGIPHVGCRTNDDCFAAQGYLHASQRFGQMDLRRRFVRGRLSEIFGFAGEPVLRIDRQSRLFIATRDGERLEDRLWQSADAQTQAAITAYTHGVNAWLADLRAHRNDAHITADWPIPPDLAARWDVLDTAACMLGLLEDLTNDSDEEIDEGTLAAALPPDEFFDLFGLMPASPATILGAPQRSRSAGEDPAIAALRQARPRLSEVRALLASAAGTAGSGGHSYAAGTRTSRGYGSNNWIVSPAQTANNRALLANDPHLGLENPPIWYVNSMDATDGDLHVAGVSFAGVPGIILGHNEHVAWGATTCVYDMADVYVETLTSSAAVLFNGAPVPLTRRILNIEQLGFGTHMDSFYYVPHHGPVIAMDIPNGRAISVHWVGHEADTDLNFIYAMMRSTSAQEAKAALRNLTATGQNFVVADVDGNIGWYPYSRVPQRPWAQQYPPYLPLPGTGEAEWQGYIPYDELPQAENPMAGYLATANGDMNGSLQDGDPLNDGTYLQHFVADGYREQRIQERLETELGNLTRASMESIQADVHSSIGEDMVPPILALAQTATSADANGALVIQALTEWTYECPTGLVDVAPDSAIDTDPLISAGSAGCLAFHALMGRLNRAVFNDELAAAGLNRHARIDALVLLLARPNALAKGTAYWDNVNTPQVETSSTVVINAINRTGEYLVSELGPTTDDWRWGRKHTLTLENGFVDTINIGPYANDGGYSTIDVGHPNNPYADDYRHFAGPSMRLACELSRAGGVDCSIQLPGGQREFTDSPFYSDLFQLWLRNTPFGLWFEPDEVAMASREQVVIKPE